MNTQFKYRNFMKHDNTDGTVSCFIKVDGETVEVSLEVYEAYAEIGYKMEYMETGIKCDRYLKNSSNKPIRDKNGNLIKLPEREVSLNLLIDENWDFGATIPSPEDIYLKNLEIDLLYESLDSLDEKDRSLINALFFDGKTEDEYSKKTGIPRRTINYRKNRILFKLKKNIQKK